MTNTKIQININNQLITILNANKINIEELFIILCFHLNEYTLLADYFITYTQEQRVLYFQRFIRKGIIIQSSSETNNFYSNFSLVKSYQNLAMSINQSNLIIISTNVEESNVVETPLTKYELFLIEFRELFPEGIKNGGNLYLRGNIIDIEKKMNKFLNKYKYDFNTILEATKSFLHKFTYKNDFTYCPAAEYFILKDNKSTLASECQAIKDVKEGSTENFDQFTHQLM